MIRLAVYILFLFCGLIPVNAQRILTKSIPQKHGQVFHINASNSYHLNLRTVNSPIISVKAVAEGEYENDVLLNLFEEGSDIFIGVDFHPDRKNRNDKLGAHKILSVSMDIEVPRSSHVFLIGNSATLSLAGTYQKLNVNLIEGRCELRDIYGEIEVITQKADIELLTSFGVVDAKTEYGVLKEAKIPLGPATYRLRSSSGNILIIESN